MNWVFQILKTRFGKRLKRNFLLKRLTTIKIGGPAKYFIRAKTEKDLIDGIDIANKFRLKWCVIGDGSNLIPSDDGFDGLIIKNEIAGFSFKGLNSNKKLSSSINSEIRVIVGVGENLTKFISKLNRLGFAGMEKMVGIPGTIGGAIYGCAGAYGQDISNCLVRVKVFDGSSKLKGNDKKIFWLSKKQCKFSYRESIFKKKKNLVILAAEFKFKNDDPEKLKKISREIIKLREEKYWPKLSCPGSFFKNVVIKNIKPKELRRKFLSILQKISGQGYKEKVKYGKIPAGYLLELVGAKNMGFGGIKVAEHHANLIYNFKNGSYRDVRRLAEILKYKIRKKFGIELEEEIQYI